MSAHPSNALARDTGSPLEAFMNGLVAFHSIKPVYPGYIAFKIKRALLPLIGNPDGIIASVGEIETIGDCRYAIPVTDFEGQTYRIMVEVRS
jgi:hypothetical protein